MADDPEKRFHSIMDKLFSSPKSASTQSGSFGVESSSRGRKRPNPDSALALVEPKTRGDMAGLSQRSLAPAEAPLCRPWDRGDLMRRMATFKSMTWFAKPKVVSAVNCARKGWINLDMDIIRCEACGARLLFSTPSSWTQQQVEKAALVFSLKLDSGHKLLCPWIDNVCDERLAEFPPTSPPLLVDKFRERSHALMQLLALPVISSAAIEHMRSTQLEEFLKQPPILDYGKGSISISQASLQIEMEADSDNLYYQAQKLISLCGWEPRSLPYFVECKNRPKQLIQDADTLHPSNVVNGQNTSISLYSSTANETKEASEDFIDLSGLRVDPHSVVLDCKLCGASVGLWTFSTVARPLELLRLVGCAEINSKKNCGQDSSNQNKFDERGDIVNSVSKGTKSFLDRQSNLNLTIAGGPPPTRQNFKATISLPVIGRNLRARFSYDSEFRDRTFNDQEPQSGMQNKNTFLEENRASENRVGEQLPKPESLGKLKSNTTDEGKHSCAISEQSSSLNLENREKGSSLGEDCDIYTSLEGTNICGEGSFLDSIMDFPIESITDIAQGFDQSNRSAENSQNVGSLDPPAGSFGSSQDRMSSLPDLGANVTTGHDNRMSNLDIQNASSSRGRVQETIKNTVQNPVNSETVVSGKGKENKQILDKEMEFDPIRQHRHFCPWIVSTDNGAAGWQQTLSALFRVKEHASPTQSPPSTSMIKVDNPIASVRKLFRSPSTKRTKPSNGLS